MAHDNTFTTSSHDLATIQAINVNILLQILYMLLQSYIVHILRGTVQCMCLAIYARFT